MQIIRVGIFWPFPSFFFAFLFHSLPILMRMKGKMMETMRMTENGMKND
jgi:hypothetical protein